MNGKEEAIRGIVIAMTKYNPEKLSDIEIDIRLALKDYDVNLMETAIVEYNGGKNEGFIKHFIIAKTVQGCSDRTLEHYTKITKVFLDKIGKNADEVTADDVRLYLALRERQDKVSKTTVGNEFRVLSSFFTHLTNEELIVRNPMIKLQHPKQPKTKKNAFTEMDVEMIRSACATNRETAMIEVMLSTGCRVSEITQIRRDQCKESFKIIGKGNKERTVFLNAKAMISIQKYLSERKDNNPYLFPCGIPIVNESHIKKGNARLWYANPKNIGDGPMDKSTFGACIRKLGKRAGVNDCHPHRFRRTCATFALRRGMPIEQVSMMLGHSQISTTQIYLDLRDEDLKSSHEKFVV